MSADRKTGQIFYAIIAFSFAVMLIYLFCSFIWKAVFSHGEERKICLYALPFFVVLAVFLVSEISIKGLGGGYYTGDEKNIWDAAVRLYPFFFVYTSEIFLICFFIFPVVMAPSIVKIAVCSFVFGYTIRRIKRFYKTDLAFVLYGLCLIRPVYEMGIRVHRMHWYGILYLFFVVKVYFDSKEEDQTYTAWTVIFLSMISAVLTVLRREGMYLFVFGAVMMVLAYAKDKGIIKRKLIYKVLIPFVLIEILFYIPALKNGFGEKSTTYRAYFVHMLGEKSFDRALAAEELRTADQFMNIEIIDKYNRDLGIEGFADCMYDWPGWRDGSYYSFRPHSAVSSDEFAKSVVEIIKKEPVVFAKSRIRAFCAAAYRANSYNLFLPLFMLIIIMGYSILKKDKQLEVISSGVLIHTGITALTMPASYFKYFYQMMLFSYFFIVVILIDLHLNSKAH